jgi:CO/xanthine dehydrogenase Mo-binding subunit
MTQHLPTRRRVLAGTGALLVCFSLTRAGLAQLGEVQGAKEAAGPKLPGALGEKPMLDAWIRIDANGAATVFTGKAELGQGIKTALLQVAADELALLPQQITLVTADTARTANEGYTSGSLSMQNSATAIRHAAAQARQLLIAEAARRLSLSEGELRTDAGEVLAPDGRRLSYGELVSDTLLHVSAKAVSALRPAAERRYIGHAFQRVDIPAKVTGGEAYIQDRKLPGMLHARVVRPPQPGASLDDVDAATVEHMPGVEKVVRDGDFLAVVANSEWQAIKAMRALSAKVRWIAPQSLPSPNDLTRVLEASVAQTGVVADIGTGSPAGRVLEATYTRPYQMHGSIGPSCAVAVAEPEMLTIWSHTQGVFPDRTAIAEMLDLPIEKVRCIHVEGSGCYGHNGADDAAADAAVIARAMPRVPIRVQWTREQEHVSEPYGPAMQGKVRATLTDDGRIGSWEYAVWSNTHSTRPGPAGALLAARQLAKAAREPEPKQEINPSGNGDRNAVPLYDIPRKHVLWHFIKDMPLRVSALRGLGAYLNVFALESFMDELAQAAGVDPVQFRLRHLSDPRAREVVTLAAEQFGWANDLPSGRGKGFAFARYKNLAAYCALAAEVEIEPATGYARVTRAVAAVDSGEIVNLDGIRNQIEGGIIQSLSWTMYESVDFDRGGIRSTDWSSYPILRFGAVPDTVEVHVVARPSQPFLGTGEASQGPTAAAIGNAIASVTGHRLRDLPFTRDKIRAAYET